MPPAEEDRRGDHPHQPGLVTQIMRDTGAQIARMSARFPVLTQLSRTPGRQYASGRRGAGSGCDISPAIHRRDMGDIRITLQETRDEGREMGLEQSGAGMAIGDVISLTRRL